MKRVFLKPFGLSNPGDSADGVISGSAVELLRRGIIGDVEPAEEKIDSDPPVVPQANKAIKPGNVKRKATNGQQ